MADAIAKVKPCTGCGFRGPLAAFVRNTHAPQGFGPRCLKCHNKAGAAWRASHPKRAAELQQRYREANRGKVRDADLAWRRANPEKAWQTLYNSRMKHRDRRVARTALRHARKLRATPPWLTAEHRSQIAVFYEAARLLTFHTGIPHQVDHIVPLRGRNVRGLHVPWNLQILTASENHQKSNKVDDAVKAVMAVSM